MCGLSPRGRGKPSAYPRGLACRGSIPAWAGETLGVIQGCMRLSVYPRVGGGNPERLGILLDSLGLSPRGRGKPYHCALASIATRSIPAWAGETDISVIVRSPPPVYPRVGGGNNGRLHGCLQQGGLSPRGRGKPSRRQAAGAGARSIPAWAGETCPARLYRRQRGVYPRVGGGNRWQRQPEGEVRGLSPRGRGKRTLHPERQRRDRSIPAWAGETDFCDDAADR